MTDDDFCCCSCCRLALLRCAVQGCGEAATLWRSSALAEGAISAQLELGAADERLCRKHAEQCRKALRRSATATTAGAAASSAGASHPTSRARPDIRCACSARCNQLLTDNTRPALVGGVVVRVTPACAVSMKRAGDKVKRAHAAMAAAAATDGATVGVDRHRSSFRFSQAPSKHHDSAQVQPAKRIRVETGESTAPSAAA